jgi:hypothetical protein
MAYVLPDDVLGVISEFSKPLKRRTVSTFWGKRTEQEMLDYLVQLCLIEVKRQIREEDYTFPDNVERLEIEDNTVLTEDTPLEVDLGDANYINIYVLGHTMFDVDIENISEWSGDNLAFHLEKGELVTQFIDKNGKVIR